MNMTTLARDLARIGTCHVCGDHTWDGQCRTCQAFINRQRKDAA